MNLPTPANDNARVLALPDWDRLPLSARAALGRMTRGQMSEKQRG